MVTAPEHGPVKPDTPGCRWWIGAFRSRTLRTWPTIDRIWRYLAIGYIAVFVTVHATGVDFPPGERLLNAILLAGPAYFLARKLRYSPRSVRWTLFSGLSSLSAGLVLSVGSTIPTFLEAPLLGETLVAQRSVVLAFLAFGFFLVLLACLQLIERSREEHAQLLASREEARRSSQRYRDLFEGMREAVFESEASGRFVSVNPACLDLLGYESEEEIRGIDIPTQLYADPEQRLRLTERACDEGFVRDYEVELKRRDGSIIHVLVNSTISRDEQGNVKGFRGTMRDVTEAYAARAEISRLQELNRNVIESLSSGLLVLDHDLRAVVFNRGMEGLTGLSRESVIGRTPWEALPSLVGTGMKDRAQEALGGKTVRRERVSLPRQDGSEVFVADSFSPLVDQGGEIVGVLCFLEELTVRIQLEQQLIQAEKVAAVGQMVSGIAHEINNPLTSVSGYAQLLLASDVAPEVKEDLQKIADAADRCGQVVRGLLTYSRKHEHRMTPVDLADALERTYELKAYELSVDDIDVERDYGEDLPLVRGDRYQLQQVVLNLLQNACDAIRENGRTGTIRLSARGVGGRVVVGVFNTGRPIPENVLRRVFDPFYTTKEVGRGTGLGLSVAQNIVRDHDGVICVRNVSDGVQFEFELPALPSADSATSGTSEPSSAATDVHLERARILVVDDEDTIQELFISALPDAEVTTVDNGRTAIERMEEEDWDAVVTDIKMPGGVSGLDLMDWAREHRPDLVSRIVLMTGAALAEGKLNIALPRDTPVLLKPFCLMDLRNHVAEAVSRTEPVAN